MSTSEILSKPLNLYRDCLRAARVVSQSHGVNCDKMRDMIRSEFRKNQHLSNADDIHTARWNAVKALHNYLMFSSGYTSTETIPSSSEETPES